MPNAVGRPRLKTSTRPSMDSEAEILDAAAELFSTHGYSATSTRRIAESVGLRQSSLYHYFPTKQSILNALLLSTVETTLSVVHLALDGMEPAALRLHFLAKFDAAQLATSRWNLGALYLLPEVRGPEFAEFVRARATLRSAYAALADQVAAQETLSLGPFQRELPFRLVETVINIRMDEQILPDDLAQSIAEAAVNALRI